MKPKEFAKYLDRDGHKCYHCGRGDDTLVVQHRIGRGMGGKNKKAEKPSNYLTLCSEANGLLESSADFAAQGRDYGWKLSNWQIPEEEAVYEAHSGLWWFLNDDGTRTDRPNLHF